MLYFVFTEFSLKTTINLRGFKSAYLSGYWKLYPQNIRVKTTTSQKRTICRQRFPQRFENLTDLVDLIDVCVLVDTEDQLAFCEAVHESPQLQLRK